MIDEPWRIRPCVLCPRCGRPCGIGAGLNSHIRSRHPELIPSALLATRTAGHLTPAGHLNPAAVRANVLHELPRLTDGHLVQDTDTPRLRHAKRYGPGSVYTRWLKTEAQAIQLAHLLAQTMAVTPGSMPGWPY
jgi:hypothetical protein